MPASEFTTQGCALAFLSYSLCGAFGEPQERETCSSPINQTWDHFAGPLVISHCPLSRSSSIFSRHFLKRTAQLRLRTSDFFQNRCSHRWFPSAPVFLDVSLYGVPFVVYDWNSSSISLRKLISAFKIFCSSLTYSFLLFFFQFVRTDLWLSQFFLPRLLTLHGTYEWGTKKDSATLSLKKRIFFYPGFIEM